MPVFIRYDEAVDSLGCQSIDQGTCTQLGTTGSASIECGQTSLTDTRIVPRYPSMLVYANLDFKDLASLASLEVGRFTGQRLIERPRGIAHFLRGTTWSYCHYVPSYYAQSILVRTATDCVIAKVKHLLLSEAADSDWEALAVASYSKALSELQEAISSTSQCPTVEALCATQILSLYEVGHCPLLSAH